MTPAEFIARERRAREISSWILTLVPPGSKGSPLTHLPPELKRDLETAGIFSNDPIGMYATVIDKLDWARDSYGQLVKLLPPEEQEKLQPSEQLAVGAIHDAEFNGFVRWCDPGFAICVPTGALMLISFAAELYSLNQSIGFQRIVISGDYPSLGWVDKPILRAMRTRQFFANRKSLGPLYPNVIANELEFLLANYARMGVTSTPSMYEGLQKQFGYKPATFEPSRFGHPLEAGSHFSAHGLRFLLLHECGHILKDHFSNIPSIEQEFEADHAAFELGVRSAKSNAAAVASLLGAWLALAIARRVEMYGLTDSSLSHPPAQERLNRLFYFVKTTKLIGFFSRHRTLYLLSDLERRDALLANITAGRRQEYIGRNEVVTLVNVSLAEGTDETFMGQMPRWMLQFSPQLFISLGAARVTYERRIRERPDDVAAVKALQMIMKVYNAAGNNTASAVASRLSKAYTAAVRRSAKG